MCRCYQLTGKNVLPLGRGRLQSTLPFLYFLFLWCYSIWDHENFPTKNSGNNVRKTINWLAGLPTKNPSSFFELVHRPGCLACYLSRQCTVLESLKYHGIFKYWKNIVLFYWLWGNMCCRGNNSWICYFYSLKIWWKSK